ncbi:MAG: Undecaprenyl-phosphate mannosyltransferase [Microgenomates bacterium OLB22]|nr:MAG: Undecaprenyl-phosphate mannosyltransferase [Microgenomates bacterium OLB22]
MKKQKAVIVIATYNERENISKLLPLTLKYTSDILNWNVSILVVDDNSPDGTQEVVKDFQKEHKSVHLLTGEKQGLGAAYRRGFSYAIDTFDPDILFEMDGDLQHDPGLIPSFLKKIDQGADFVIGSRFIKGGSIPENWELHRKIFSLGANLGLCFGFMNFKVHDWTSGFRAIKADFINKTLHRYTPYDGYVFQIAVLDTAIKEGLKVAEVPLNFKDRKHGSSKIPALQYIITIMLYVMQHSSFFKFAVVGVIGAIIDFGLSYVGIELLSWPVALSTIISAEGSVLSNFSLNNLWSFAHKRIDKSSHLLNAFLKFHVVALGSDWPTNFSDALCYRYFWHYLLVYI